MNRFNSGRLPGSLAYATAAVLLTLGVSVKGANPDSFESLARTYADEVQPLVARYCLECHTTEDREGDLDLEALTRFEDVRKTPGTWRKVAEMLESGEMPPKDEPQPTTAEHGKIQDWISRYLKAEAYANAGDPGPVVLRRLNNAQLAYTLQDLTGFDFQPTRDFPADGAAGEGFTNAGSALVMSPSLLDKYLDVAKRVAAHAVLTPDGLRFSRGETRRDWTDELLASIRALYAEHADAEGRIPLEKYLVAAIEDRDAIARGEETYEASAGRRGLNARYLKALGSVLAGGDPSPLLDPIRKRWKTAGPDDAPAFLAEIDRWRQALTRFQSVGHMKPWVVSVDPIVVQQDVRYKLPESPGSSEVVVHLTTEAAAQPNVVVFRNLRLSKPGRGEVAIRDVRAIAESAIARREMIVGSVARCLEAAAEASTNPDVLDRASLAKKYDVDPDALGSWLECLGIDTGSTVPISLFNQRLENVGGYEFVSGWGLNETPSVVANQSDRLVNIPGELKGRGVVVHPSPTQRAGVGWLCNTAGTYTIQAEIRHSHIACGNGVVWKVEVRRGGARLTVADGFAAGPTPAKASVPATVLRPGDMVTLVVGPRDGSHACDLTAVDLTISADGAGDRVWDLARDVTADAFAANPHADGFGVAGVWHAFQEPDDDSQSLSLPSQSLLAHWLATSDAMERSDLATKVQELLTNGPEGAEPHDIALYHQLTSLGGPIIPARPNAVSIPADSRWGLDPSLFGPGVVSDGIASEDLAVRSPGVVAIRLPSELAAGAELVASAVVQPLEGGDDFVQIRITTEPTDSVIGVRPDSPVLVVAGGAAEARLKSAFDEFRRWFPPALCYEKIVPVDEVVTLTLFHREDEPLRRLMLDDRQAAELDRLWEELHFVSHDAIDQVGAYEQLMEYATQDGDPSLFEPFREPIQQEAERFRQRLVDAEPRQLDALIEFASLAFRRPTTDQERTDLRELYTRLRADEIPHDEAIHLTMARILVSPNFLYRLEKAPAGTTSAQVSDWELASRLSYFLRSSVPDAELREATAAGRLGDPHELSVQASRLLRSSDARRLAEEFACQWIQIYEFNALDEKSERHFPTFTSLRGAMYEEAILFFTDLFQTDASILSIFDADHAILNEELASHYEIPGVIGPEWRRVEGVRKHGRGGALGLAATLAKQSGASRTSPILRGNWVTEVLLGERVPNPPPDVPELPDVDDVEDLSVRQLVERHTKDIRCSGCHAKMDPYGFSLEAYDAIGRFRTEELPGQPIDTRAKLADGVEFDGAEGLRDFLLNRRRDVVVRQFCKKLLGYALGRGVMMSDEPLLDEIMTRLRTEDFRISVAVDAIVRSRQFREIRAVSTNIAEAR